MMPIPDATLDILVTRKAQVDKHDVHICIAQPLDLTKSTTDLQGLEMIE